MKKPLYLALVLLLTSAIYFGCKEKELPGSIHGSIINKATGEPIKTAGVELLPSGLKEVTGSEGQYEFNEIDPGVYKLHVTKTGYEDLVSNEIIVKSNKATPHNVEIEKLPPSLRIVNDKREDIDVLDFGAIADDITRSFNIFNDGIESLQWEITITAKWITEISKKSGEINAEGTQPIILTIDRELLTCGDNATTVHITSTNGSKELKVTATGENRQLPALNTLEATDIKMTSAIFHGVLTDEGTPSYTERGFVYNLSSMPTIENTISKLTVAVTENKTFQATATGLEESKTYYVRAYAVNKVGTAYSTNEVRCTPQKTLPIVKTDAVTNKSIGNGRATLNGTIEDTGEPAYTERGFVYGTNHNPMVEDATKKVVAGSGTGKITVNLTDLVMGEIYYVRAYATNEIGTAYGGEVVMDFNIELPIIHTKTVDDITATTATLYAEIQSIGDPAYIEAGFIYGTIANPTIDEDGVTVEKVKETGIGTVKKEIENLVEGTTYYVRAYLRNENYIAYSDIVSFKAEIPSYMVVPGYNTLMVQREDLGVGDYSSAKAMCKGSTLGGYTDWRLPTKEELMMLYNNRELIGGFFPDLYWSSSPTYVSNSAYCIDFTNGSLLSRITGQKLCVRAVRTITE